MYTLRSQFLISACLLTQARNTPDLQGKNSYYTELRAHVKQYRATLQGVNIVDNTTYRDLTGKMTTLLVYDLEAAISINQHDDLVNIIQIAKPYKDVIALKAMGDVLLQSSVPIQGKQTILSPISIAQLTSQS